jgi:hypothetical protein
VRRNGVLIRSADGTGKVSIALAAMLRVTGWMLGATSASLSGLDANGNTLRASFMWTPALPMISSFLTKFKNYNSVMIASLEIQH